MKQMSMRQRRIAEQVRQDIGASLSKGGFKNPLLDGMISFPFVWVSPDLRNARVYFTTLHNVDTEMTKEVAKALNAEAFRFQENIASTSRKNTPKIKFYADEETVRTNHIESLFNRMTVASRS